MAVSALMDINGDGGFDLMIPATRYQGSAKHHYGGAMIFYSSVLAMRHEIPYGNFTPGVDGIEIVAEDRRFSGVGYLGRTAGI